MKKLIFLSLFLYALVYLILQLDTPHWYEFALGMLFFGSFANFIIAYFDNDEVMNEISKYF